jgi:hypothetical protein
MRSLLAAGFIVALMAHLSFAGRTYICAISVGSNLEEYDCTSIGDAVARMKQWPLDKEHLGQIRVYPGVYKECIGGLWCSKDDSRWLPKHCDLLGMGKDANDVVIEHPEGTGTNDYTIIASGDNVISHLKVYNNREARNGIYLFDDCTLDDCTVETIHATIDGNANLVIRGCRIASMFGPCIRAWKSFSVSDCILNPRGWYRHLENPMGIETYGPGSIDRITIASTIKSSYWCTGAGLIGIMVNTGLGETVTISNVGMNLQLTSSYWPSEAGILRVCGIMNGIQWYEPTTNYKGRTIVRDCSIDVKGIEGSPDANGTPSAIMVDGVCVRGGGTIDLLGVCTIRTSRTTTGSSKDGYEYSLNNRNGTLAVNSNIVDFDHTKTNGAITSYAANEPIGPNDPNNPIEPNIPDSLFNPRNAPPPLLLRCPNDSIKPYRLEELDYSPTMSGENFEAPGFATLEELDYVELQEITSSQFLDPNVTYYVPYPPLLIHGTGGEEIDVIIPSDTTIVLAEDWDYGIVVYDGANVYFGEPSMQPNEPNLIYEPNDSNNPVLPVWIVGESGDPFFNNFCGIFIDRTAGTRCKLDNICLRGFYYGIQVDQQLESPISNIQAFGCYNGILSFGPNKILNSYISYYGMWSPGWPYDGYAYEFMSESWDETIFFGGTDFEIYNCLADDGDYGFTANGLYEPNEAPNFYSRDCAATNSYTGFNTTAP